MIQIILIKVKQKKSQLGVIVEDLPPPFLLPHNTTITMLIPFGKCYKNKKNSASEGKNNYEKINVKILRWVRQKSFAKLNKPNL